MFASRPTTVSVIPSSDDRFSGRRARVRRWAFISAWIVGAGATAWAGTPGRLAFSWQDNSSNESGFRVERATNGSPFVLLTTVGAGITRFDDHEVEAGKRYAYRVVAFNAGGSSDYSSVVEGSVAAAAENTEPTISPQTDLTTSMGEEVPAIHFAIGDGETPTAHLTLVGNTSNPALVPVENLRFGGSDTNRTLRVTPMANQTGWSTIWVKVSDGELTATSSFVLVVTAAAPDGPQATLLNLSARGRSHPGDPLTAGFVVAGGANKRVLLRAIGPTLAENPFLVTSALPNPRLTLRRWTGSTYASHAENTDWGAGSGATMIEQTAAQLFAFALAAQSRDAALLLDVPSGQFTATAEDEDGGSGIALLELYDVDGPADARLINLSTRGFVGTGSDVLILGFVVAGEGSARFLIRAVGPGIAASPYLVPGALVDPELEVYRQESDGGTAAIFRQTDWGIEAGAAETAILAAQLGAFPLSADSRDAAAILTLGPGVYTAIVRGRNGTQGTALAEIYLAP